MAKPPPKKPTEEFAQFNFSNDGRAQKVVEKLPDTKAGQEDEIGRRFAAALSMRTGSAWHSRPLAEADHDFLLVSGDAEIEVQAVEIVAKRDFLTPISAEAWRDSTPGFTSTVMFSQDDIWGVDLVKRRQVIWQKIALKLAKHYSKPARPLWLLVWTVYTGLPLAWVEAGKVKTSKSISFARRELSGSSAAPFDEIWAWAARDEAVRIWPSDAAIEPDLDNYEVTQTSASPGIFIPASAMTLVKPKKG
ncbi:MAG: hypothetical protein KF779_04695 [Hyphomonadaceae bacterium]|nr:hypothetical protein [Hyphomonadaceae bacterium]